MRISFAMAPLSMVRTIGYGVAGFNVVTALNALGHETPFKSPDAPIKIRFSQPDMSPWSNPDAYHIQYTPWESTELKPGWLEAFNENCDEVWTTSPLIKEWFIQAGVKEPIYVYQHGIEDMWSPLKRERKGKIKFLFIGEPASRKGGQQIFEEFYRLYKNSDEASLTIKGHTRSRIRLYDSRGSIIGTPGQSARNIEVILDEYTPEEMVDLYHEHDVFVYFSRGEGFGLIPFQGMATGMPVITPTAWAPYAHYVLPGLGVGSDLGDSPYPIEHPGKIYLPRRQELANSMEYAVENFEELSEKAYDQAFLLHEEYNWKNLTKNAFDPVIKKVENGWKR